RLKQCACQALEVLAAAAAARGEHTTSVGWARRLAALDPLSARIARALMETLAATGDRAGALQHARVHEALLRQELDAALDPAVSDFVRLLREVPQRRAANAPKREAAPDRVVRDAPLVEPGDIAVAVPRPSRWAFRVGTWLTVGVVLMA